MTAGEMGLVCSSMLLWEKIATSPTKQIAMIFEDDIKLYNNFDKGLEKIFKALPQKWDLIYIDVIKHHRFLDKWTLMFKVVNENLIKISPFRGAWGSHAYIVNQKSAQKLLELYKLEDNNDLALDCFFTKMMFKKKIRAYVSKEKIADTMRNMPSEITAMGR